MAHFFILSQENLCGTLFWRTFWRTFIFILYVEDMDMGFGFERESPTRATFFGSQETRHNLKTAGEENLGSEQNKFS